MTRLAIFALGPLRIEFDGQPLPTSRHKAFALLVYLAMCPGKQSREALSALLWPDYEQDKAFAYLRRTLWELHMLLGEGWSEADCEMISFNPDTNVLLDVVEFQSHLAAFNQHNHPLPEICQECVAHLRTAALLYRGDFLAGFSLRDSGSYEDWQVFQREALRQDYAGALQKLANLLFRAGSLSEAIVFSQRWLALDTLNEEAHRLLMKTYVLDGQRHLAIKQYQDCTRILQTEIGIAPEPETIRLYESTLSGAKNLEEEIPRMVPVRSAQNGFAETESYTGWSGERVLASGTTPSSQLPLPPTPFVGRHRELIELADLLSTPDCWLLTLLGPGGIGKTRLAIEIGRRQVDHFPEGVFPVSLSMIESERSIIPAIARSLGLTFRQNGPSPDEQLLDFLREKRLLLILDSFEQLVQWAGLLEQIHSHAPGIKILVTSRHRLLLPGEKVMEVKGLGYPTDPPEKAAVVQDETLRIFGAVELFFHAARHARETFQPSSDDWPAILKIVQLLEGIPLGLELAATWVTTLSCKEIANEINRSLDILETSFGDISERQRSIKAVFHHSWNLLNHREQTVLPRLAVFRGGFSRQAAERVAGATLRELSGLVDKSLLWRTPNGRFDLHELLRQYLAEILERLPSDSQETRRRHCAFYSTQLSRWNEQLSGVKQGQVLREIETNLENCQVAWEWAVNQKKFEQMGQAIHALGMFYLRRARLTEGWEIYRKAYDAIQNNTPLQDNPERIHILAWLRIWQAALSMNLEQFEQAGQLIQEGLQLLDHSQLDQQKVIHERIFGLVIQAQVANLQYDPDATLRNYRQAVAISREAKVRSPEFFIFFWRFLMGGSVTKELYLEMMKNLNEVRQSGNPFELGCHLFVLGTGALYHEYRMEKAEPLLEESIRNFALVDDPSTQVMIFKTLGYLQLAKGMFGECYDLKLQEYRVVQDIGDRRMVGITHAEIGEVLCHLGKYAEAEEEIRKGMKLVKDRSEVEYALRHRYLGDVLLAEGKYEEARAAYQFSYRFFLSVDMKGWILTALTGLSRVEFALGDRTTAWLHLKQALHLYQEIQLYTFFVYLTVADIALLLADRGEIRRALALYRLASQQGYLAQSIWFKDLYGKIINGACASITAEEQVSMEKYVQETGFSRIIDELQNSIFELNDG